MIQIAILAELGDDVHVISRLVNIVELYDILMANHLHDVDFGLNIFEIVSIEK